MKDPRDRVVSYRAGKNWARSVPLAERKSNRARIHQVVKAAGYTSADADAFVTWLAIETDGTWSPKAREYGQRRGRGGFGIAMWTADRARALVKWANDVGYDPYSMGTQLGWLYLELTDGKEALPYNGGSVIGTRGAWGQRNLRAALQKAKTRQEKVGVWMRYFFRPALQTTSKVRQAMSVERKSMMTSAPQRVVTQQTANVRPTVSTKGSPNLRQRVMNYQKLLNKFGGQPLLRIDGIFGPATNAAAKSLGMNGAADYERLKRNEPVSHPTSTVSSVRRALALATQDRRRVISAYQTLLNTKQTRYQQLVVDGLYGPNTHAVATSLGRDPVLDLLSLARGQRIAL